MLQRILEPELMDTAEDAREYDAMDHAAVNTQFVTDFLSAFADWSLHTSASSVESRPVVLDLGAGSGLIPIELCRRAPAIRVVAVDAAEHMLAVAKQNVAAAGLADRIELVRGDAKDLASVGWAPPTTISNRAVVGGSHPTFSAVISNSILHHIVDPREVIAEAVRVAAPGALQFHRDLSRPNDEAQVEQLVSTYTADATPYQQKLLADSLRAALTLLEIRELIAEFGFAPESVQMNSDRHWTWSARNF
jgi:precorrin-6B methylase 2